MRACVCLCVHVCVVIDHWSGNKATLLSEVAEHETLLKLFTCGPSQPVILLETVYPTVLINTC